MPVTRYAKSGEIHIAYQIFGNGFIDLVLVPGFVSHIENYWEEPSFARWLYQLGSFTRVVMFDKRGTGLSDRVNNLPNMDERMDDIQAVIDDSGIETAAIMGISEGGPLAMLFAGTYPDRCRALVLYGTFARFSSWIPNEEALEALIDYMDRDWGTGKSLPMFAPSRRDDKAFQQWWGRFERLGANPSAAIDLMRMNSKINITDILPSIRVPTLVIHRTGDVTVDVGAGRFLSENIQGAKYVELPGYDHLPFIGDNSEHILHIIEEFLTGAKSKHLTDRVLATVLFTDIVGSTIRAETLGDQRWRDLLAAHDKIVCREITLFRGTVIKSLGDGFLVTFNGPARAIRCALAIRKELHSLGIETRMGLHTGEIEVRNGDLLGIAVHIASRIVSLADSNEILVSRTVKDLVAGSGISFKKRDTQQIDGLAETMDLYLAIEQDQEWR